MKWVCSLGRVAGVGQLYRKAKGEKPGAGGMPAAVPRPNLRQAEQGLPVDGAFEPGHPCLGSLHLIDCVLGVESRACKRLEPVAAAAIGAAAEAMPDATGRIVCTIGFAASTKALGWKRRAANGLLLRRNVESTSRVPDGKALS